MQPDDRFYELEACHYYRRPPAASEVAHRVLALGALWLRSQIEVEAVLEESRPWAEAEAERTILLAWLRSSGVYADLSFEELPIMEAPVGGLTHDALVDSTWRVEAAVPLLWGLGLLEEMPPYDEEVHAEEVIENVPLGLDCSAGDCELFCHEAGLVGFGEIRRQRDLAELWHRRAAGDEFPRDEDRQRIASIAFERLFALNWLCGLGRCWDETPTDVAP